MSLFHKIGNLDEQLAADIEKNVERVFSIFRKHCRNYERKVRLIKNFEKELIQSNLAHVESEIGRIERLERIELIGNKREKKTLHMVLKELVLELHNQSGKKIKYYANVDSGEHKELFEIEELIKICNELIFILRNQMNWFSKYHEYNDRNEHKQELIDLVRKEGQLLFGIEEHDLEELRRRTLATLQHIKVDEVRESFDCQKRDFHIGGITGTVYVKDFTKIPKSGVVILPGFGASRTIYDLLCRSIAREGLLAYVIDLPSHGSQGNFSFALISEYAIHAVKIIRGYFQVNKVGLIGHSTGAICTIFALVGYNRRTESELFDLFEKYSETLKKLEGWENHPRIDLVHKDYEDWLVKELDRYLNLIKRVILNSVKETRFNLQSLTYSGRIDLVLCISMPPRFQFAFPPAAAHLQKNLPAKIVKEFMKVPNLRAEKASELPGRFAKFKRDKNFKGVQFINFKMPDHREFLRYAISVKNPLDYLNLLNHFADESEFVKKFRNKYILGVKKYFLYGSKDELMIKPVDPFIKFLKFFEKSEGNPDEYIESIYSMLNGKIMRFEGLNHALSGTDTKDIYQVQVASHNPALRQITKILKRSLS